MKAPANQSDVVISMSKRLKISKEESDVVTPRAIPVEMTRKAASAIPASKLANEMHKILLIKYLLNENKNNSEISKITGISSTFYFNKLLGTSKNISMKRLQSINNSLLEFDLKCKTMNFEKELELELLLLTN